MDRLATGIPAAGILACSRAAEAAQRKLRPHRRVRVVYPSADLVRFSQSRLESRTAVRRKLGLPEEARVVGIVARLQRWKGVHLLLKASVELGRAFPDLVVVVVGGAHALEPDYARWVRRYADKLGISGRVLFAGHQPDVAEWMLAMDVVVNASVEGEPFGIVIVEAMALGKPVVAFRAGGPAEIVRHDRDGLLIEPDRPGDLVKALHRLLSDAGLRERLGAAARIRAQDFGVDRFAQGVAEAMHAATTR